MHSSFHYRAEADHARRLAEISIQPNVAEELCRVAEEFERIAETYADQRPSDDIALSR
jgi:anaerobic selenocysteine-containing dehydrogenase